MDQHASATSNGYQKLMLAHTPVGLALFDAEDFRLLDMNAAYSSLLDTFLASDWTQGRAIGYPFTAWLPGAIDTGIVSIFRNVIDTGVPFRNGEFVFPAFEQGVTYWDWSLDPIYDESRHIVYLQQTVLNITAQVHARRQAEETQHLMQQANLISEAERQRLEVVETVARVVRASLDTEYIGKATVQTIREHFSLLRVAIHIADPVQRILQLLEAYTVPGNEAIFERMQQVPYSSSLLIAQVHQRRDPLVIEDEQIAKVSGILESESTTISPAVRGYVCIPLWSHEHFEGAITAVFDVPVAANGIEVQTLADCGKHIATALAHSRMHAEVEQERARLHLTLDQLPEGIFLFDVPVIRIRYANEAAARILGVPLSMLAGKDLTWLAQVTNVSDPDRQPRPPEAYPAAVASQGETVSHSEGLISRPDGSTITTLSSTAPLRVANGNIIGIVSVFQDITDRKTVEQQKAEFLSIASHELRTPITSIQVYAEILQRLLATEQPLDRRRVERATGIMIEQGRRLTRLIEEMLELSRIETAHLSLQCAPYDLVAVMRRLVEEQAFIAPKHRLRLTVDEVCPNDSLVGSFDGDRMEQVFNNLLSNAVKYSPLGSEIELGLRYRSDVAGEVLIWVKDRGIGIDDIDLPYIFDRFHRSSSLDRSISGFGIGLYLVSEFVKRHGGRVWAESCKGVGTTFYVQLPLN